MYLESKRLVYERLTQDHAVELQCALCDPKVHEHVDDGLAPTFDELIKSFALRESGTPDHRRDEIWIDYVVRTKDSATAIGRVEATVIEQRAEVAYLLGPAHWQKGYGSEALVWLQHFLQENYDVGEFWATVTPENEPSKRLLLKNSYVEVSSEKLPQLTSYDEGDWVFFRLASKHCDGS